jgi:hypothetical protein
MSDALPLLPRPKLDQYEKLAERLRAACQSGELEDIRKWATDWIKTVADKRGLDLSTQQKSQMGWQVGSMVRDWSSVINIQRGRAVEMFVRRGDDLVNVGWHLYSES